MSINLIDQNKIDITLSNLIIKVFIINESGLTINDFSLENNLWGKANIKLLIMTEMNEPVWDLQNIIDTIIIPKRFVFQRDYIVAHEQLIHGAGIRIAPYLIKSI